MTTRTYQIADAIIDDAEYLEINLESIESVQAYAENGMNENISDAEAEAIFDACWAYIAHVESPNFDGQGQMAWAELVRRPLEDWEADE